MKPQFFIFLFLIFGQLGYAQTYSFENFTNFDLLDAGPITSKNEVQGYYLFFQKENVSNDSTEFIVKILDQNLNELTNKQYKAAPNTSIEALVFNGKAILLKQFTKNGSDITFQVQNMSFTGDFKLMGEQSIKHDKESRSIVHGVPDQGFVNIYGTDKQRAILEYYENAEKQWTYQTPEDIKWEQLDFITAYGDRLIFSSYRGNPVTKGGDYFLKAFSSTSGELLYEKVMTFYGYDHEIDRGFVNPIKDEIWISGDYFDKGDDEEPENSNGLFVMKISPDGEILDSDYAPWDGKIERYSKTYKKGKLKNGFLHMHDFVFLKSGEVFGIAEQYRKAFRAWGIAESIVSAGVLGRLIKVEIGDLLLFRFGINAKLKETKRNRKPLKTVLPNKGIWGGVLIPGKKVGQIMADQHAYDFSHVSVDNDHESFTTFYYMKEALTKKQKKQYNRDGRWILRTVTYKDRKWTKDKFYLTDGKGDATIHIMPAKPGYVLVREESTDYSGLRLEKLK